VPGVALELARVPTRREGGSEFLTQSPAELKEPSPTICHLKSGPAKVGVSEDLNGRLADDHKSGKPFINYAGSDGANPFLAL